MTAQSKPPSRISLKPTAARGKERKMPSRNPLMGAMAIIEDGCIVLRLPLISEEKRKKSSTGKSILYANTYGPKIVRQRVNDELVPVEVDGIPLRIIASAYLSVRKESEKSASVQTRDSERVTHVSK